MSGQFKVGEIAIAQNCSNPRNNGAECEIIDPLMRRHLARAGAPGDIWVAQSYRVRLPDGQVFAAMPHQLRKRRPPSTDESHQAMLDCIERARRPVMEPA